jgi:murein DD-endopeptidase / murein LD-carboxypeptidase
VKKIFVIASIVCVILSTSCTVSKHVDNGHVKGNDKKRNYYSEKLGIDLTKNYNAALIQEVIGWLGTPYAYGQQDKSGTDCSGFVMQVYKTVYQIQTARSANGIYEQCSKIKRAELKQGELVFFKINTQHVGHVGIYLQDTYFIHASSSKGVMVSNLDLEYWTKYFVSGGRLTH